MGVSRGSGRGQLPPLVWLHPYYLLLVEKLKKSTFAIHARRLESNKQLVKIVQYARFTNSLAAFQAKIIIYIYIYMKTQSETTSVHASIKT